MASNSPVIYDRSSARRIAEVVRRAESTLKRSGVDGLRQSTAWLNVWLLRVAADESGGGKYAGKSFSRGNTKPTASGNLTASDLGVVSDVNDVLFFNLEEVDSGDTHTLTEDDQTPYAIGLFLDFTDENPPRKIIVGLSLASEDCEPPA